MGVSAPSLHRESTDSDIGNNGEITLISSNEVHSESENSNFQMYRVDAE